MHDSSGTGIVLRVICAALYGVLLLTGCRTLPPADTEYYIPRPNGALLIASTESTLFSGSFEPVLRSLLGEDIYAGIERADQLSMALLDNGRIALLLEGRYPKNLTALSLRLSRKWKRAPGSPARWALSDGGAELVPLGGGVLAVGLPDASPMILAAGERNATGLVRQGNLTVLIPAIERIGSGGPLAGECLIAASRVGESIQGSMEWRFANEMRARISLPLIKLAVWSYLSSTDPSFERGALSTTVDGSKVLIDGFRISAAGLGAILERLLLFPGETKELE